MDSSSFSQHQQHSYPSQSPVAEDKPSVVDDLADDQPKSSKPPVVRGARACTVCRAAKMKCVGAEDGEGKCQRCKRAGVDCVFEKHRRGRKPGSKLSEASKMLRRLEKGLNTAKAKQSIAESSQYARAGSPTLSDPSYRALRPSDPYGSSSSTLFPSNELPPLGIVSSDGYAPAREEEDDEAEAAERGMFPDRLIRKENQRHSFFSTILNPDSQPPSQPQSIASAHAQGEQSPGGYPAPRAMSSASNSPADPIDAGLLTLHDATTLFDLIFLRFNPFICLFDPALHSVTYVRSRSPFLFTVLLMAGCKFFKPELYRQVQKLAQEMAVRAFAEGWKSVEVVQAFACLTYWKEPDDTRTWTYIGYACRMAVELGLNRYVPARHLHGETEFALRERRNRERTYLVLFVHDRSLSMQTGRQWMLPEDDLVRHSATWHEEGGSPIRPEDVIVAAFVQLRRIAGETTDVFYLHKGGSGNTSHSDVNYEVLLRNCNGKLTQWMDTWQHEMRRAGGESFHFSILSFFRLHVRLFLNSFGIQASMSPTSRAVPSLQALSACFTSAIESLQIVVKEFASMQILRYGQESITVMTAYSAVFLLKLMRSSNTLAELHEGATNEIYSNIAKTADAYSEASQLSPASTSAAAHARFLRSLIANDIFKARQTEKERPVSALPPIDTRMHASAPGTSGPGPVLHSPPQMYPQTMVSQAHEHNFHFPASPHLPAHPSAPGGAGPGGLHDASSSSSSSYGPMEDVKAHPSAYAMYAHYANGAQAPPHHSELDAHYWRNMFRELGFGEGVESSGPATAMATAEGVRGMPPHYGDPRMASYAPPPPPPPPPMQQHHSSAAAHYQMHQHHHQHVPPAHMGHAM
ncbi:hypothetical protein PUNSTDRAFT_126610 [Punctularia strigosozonata HHB-11173 SS5]|uniref:uncharacterized protein n=1 Tax=Punctularia strigosozonata (strain HHB-11173) TaxID=741275 RepID=UPI00044185A3|nr:uncharacterized protein PUNSTDRAFT_126610 [Punctularia strigosozonata HHB-11173 SS5]EIN07589.1 hypothetical protein PUNSTDRAFT_126610 [Punctularia strigosozonata HHB-11173 SS5]